MLHGLHVQAQLCLGDALWPFALPDQGLQAQWRCAHRVNVRDELILVRGSGVWHVAGFWRAWPAQCSPAA